MLQMMNRDWPVQCRFRYLGEQCPFFAIARDPDGSAYCKQHGSPDNRDIANRESAIRRWFERMRDPAARRRVLEGEKSVRPQDLVELQIELHPEWQRQAGESEQAYTDRMSNGAEALGFRVPSRRRG